MPLTPGTRLSRYEVRTQIGSGGMGEVYLAQDINLGRRVALKLMPLEFTTATDAGDHKGALRIMLAAALVD